jgi:hypothetical protein
MADPDAPPLQAGELLQLLDRHRVRYVVVGGLAATVHGATRVTFDIDLVPEWTDDNLERLATALREAKAHLVAPETPTPSSFPIGDLDVIIGTPTATRGVLARYDALQSRAIERKAFGVTILIAALDDVIESKEALSRESDLVALPELHRLRARASRVGATGEGGVGK